MFVFILVLSAFSLLLFINFDKKLSSDIDSFLIASAENVADSIDTIWEKEREQSPSITEKSITFNETVKIYFFKIVRSWALKNWDQDPAFLNILVQIFDEKGKLISTSKNIPSLKTISKEVFDIVKNNKRHFENVYIDIHTDKQIPLRILTYPKFENKKLLYILRVAISLRTKNLALNTLRLILFIMLPTSMILIGVIGAILVRIILNPVNKMIDSIHKINAQNLNIRIEIPETKDEISRLAETFNDMLDRLNNAFNSQRKLIEDLSHELKTPLSIIKREIEVALKRKRSNIEYEEILKSNVEEINRIITILENLLLISRFDGKAIEINYQRLNLNELITNILNDMKILAGEKNIEIILDEKERLFINGDKNQINSLFVNLIDNAIKYNNNNGKVEVVLSKDEKYAKIEIIDNGIGIPQEEIPYIFNRFYRVFKAKDNKGFGLGLNIVKSIVDLHNGKIEVESKVNEGSKFTVYLPLS